MWVGPPTTYFESSVDPTSFQVAELQCTPHYQDWSTVETVHVFGIPILSSSKYLVENVGIHCVGEEESCTSVSRALLLSTTRWGDVTTPFNPPNPSVQPDVTDVSALVDKFKSAPGALRKVAALLAGAPGNPWGRITDSVLAEDFGFSHISACVDAFRGVPYIYRMGKCTGTPTPPATGACNFDHHCTFGNGAGPCQLYCP